MTHVHTFTDLGGTQRVTTEPGDCDDSRQHLGVVIAALADPPELADMRERWLPTDAAIRHAQALLAAEPNADLALVPLLQPGKNRSVWTIGQEVLTLPGVVILASNDDGRGDILGYHTARRYCEIIAGEYQVTVWKERRDASDGLVSPGTTAHAVVTRDGNASVFEDYS